MERLRLNVEEIKQALAEADASLVIKGPTYLAQLLEERAVMVEALKYFAEPGDQYCGRCDGRTHVEGDYVAIEVLRKVGELQ